MSVRPPSVLISRLAVSWWRSKQGTRAHAFRIMAGSTNRDTKSLCGWVPRKAFPSELLPECARCAELLEPL